MVCGDVGDRGGGDDVDVSGGDDGVGRLTCTSIVGVHCGLREGIW